MVRNTLVLGLLGLATVSGCRAPSLDLSGRWRGTADLVVDGERKTVDLQWELDPIEGEVRGTILWDDVRREVTASSIEGPQVFLESATPNDTITFKGLFRSDTIQGRFHISYRSDPEPYPGSFEVHREQ